MLMFYRLLITYRKKSLCVGVWGEGRGGGAKAVLIVETVVLGGLGKKQDHTKITKLQTKKREKSLLGGGGGGGVALVIVDTVLGG
jgi:hypothetical protein